MLSWSSLVNFANSFFSGNKSESIKANKKASSTRPKKPLKPKCSEISNLNGPSNSCRSLKASGGASSRGPLSGRVKKLKSTLSSTSNKLSATKNKNLIKNCNNSICTIKANTSKNNNHKISATSIGTEIESDLLIISNLDAGVSDSDLIKIFKDIGALQTVAVHRDRYGNALGTADVLFQNKTDATVALKKFKGWKLLGKPMNIKYCTSKLSNEDDTDMYCVEPKLNQYGKQVGSSRKYINLTESRSLKSKIHTTAHGRKNDRKTSKRSGDFQDSLTNKDFYQLYKRFGNAKKDVIFE